MSEESRLVEERSAISLAIHGHALERWHVGFRALYRLTRDPGDTRQAFIIGAVLDRNYIAEPFLRFMIDPGGFALMREQPAIDSTTLDFDRLGAMPLGTLGHGYARHMRDNGLDPDLFLAPPGAPPGIDYFAQRLRQTHDIWHVLTGLEADLAGEIALQAFMFGQFGTPTPFLTTLFGTALCTIDNPLAALDSWRGYRRGRRAKPLLVVRWEDHWMDRVDDLRARFEIEVDAPTPEAPAQYRVEDKSLLLGFYQWLLWNRLVEALPRRLSPNVLTIASQLSAVLAAISCALGDQRHPAFYAASATGFLVAITFDNIDGAHARRTGQCSALGELLDHGLDGVTATASLLTTCFLLHVSGTKLVILCALGGVAFATVFWEQFRTGILRLPRIGPTEGVTLIAAWELVVAAGGDPARGPVRTLAVAGFVIVHAVAILTPLRRVRARAEIVPLFVFAALQIGFALRGAHAFLPAITIGLAAASMTSHLLVLKRQRRRAPVVPRGLYAAALPFLLELALPRPTVWASITLAIVVIDYAARMVREGRRA